MYEYLAEPVAIHDGDTLKLDVDLGFNVWEHNLDVRLRGIDCPELGRPDALGEKARDFVTHWFEQHPGPYVLNTVKLKGTGGDQQEKFGRYLGDVQAPDKARLVTDLLTAELARPYDGRGPRPW